MAQSRLELEVSNVGTSYIVTKISNKPSEYTITRARAEIVSGSGAQVAIKIMENPTEGTLSTVLEYGLTATPIDAFENIFFFAQERSANNRNTGSTYIGIKCDTGADNVIKVYLDIELN